MLMLPLMCLLSPGFGPASAQLNRPPDVVSVSEESDALLPCPLPPLHSGQRINKFDWRKYNTGGEKIEVFEFMNEPKLLQQDKQFSGRVERASGGASIIIKNTRLEDNGTYTCVLLEPHKQEVKITLNVGGDLKIRNVTGAASMPYIQTIQDEITWRELECRTKGVPEPEVEWTNGAGEKLAEHIPKSQNHLVHVELRLNVTRSDTYTCAATQKSIYHQYNNTIKIRLTDVNFVVVPEGEDAFLPCSLNSKENIENMEFSWSKDDKKTFLYNRGRVKIDETFRGRLTEFQHELKFGNASIQIHRAQKSDSGQYSCNIPNMKKSSHTFLQVVVAADRPTGWIVAVVILVIVIMILTIIIILRRFQRSSLFCAGPGKCKQEQVTLNSSSSRPHEDQNI